MNDEGTYRTYMAALAQQPAAPHPQTDVADTNQRKRRNPLFRGRCYLCGQPTRGWFCVAHKWAQR